MPRRYRRDGNWSHYRQFVGAGRDQPRRTMWIAGYPDRLRLFSRVPRDPSLRRPEGGCMLVIRRRAGESFLIGEDIEIEVLEVGATQVKLGIAAPKQISILRREVFLTRQQN